MSNVAIGLDIAAFAGVENAFLDDALGRRVSERISGACETKARNERTKAAEGEAFLTARDEEEKSLSLSRAREGSHPINESIT